MSTISAVIRDVESTDGFPLSGALGLRLSG